MGAHPALFSSPPLPKKRNPRRRSVPAAGRQPGALHRPAPAGAAEPTPGSAGGRFFRVNRVGKGFPGGWSCGIAAGLHGGGSSETRSRPFGHNSRGARAPRRLPVPIQSPEPPHEAPSHPINPLTPHKTPTSFPSLPFFAETGHFGRLPAGLPAPRRFGFGGGAHAAPEPAPGGAPSR